MLFAGVWLLLPAWTGCVHGEKRGTGGAVQENTSWEGTAELTAEERETLDAVRPLYDQLGRVGAHRAKEDLDRAFRSCLALVRQHPEFEPAIHHFLELASETDQLEIAVSLFTERVQADPQDGAAWYALALMRDGAARVELGQRAVEAGCRSWSCYFTLATAYAMSHRVEEGIEWFRTRAEDAEGDPAARVNAWLAESELLRYGVGTAADVERLLVQVAGRARAGQGWEVALERLGMLYTSLHRYTDAREALALALEVHRAMHNTEGVLSVLFNQVVLEQQVGDLEVAAGLCEEALEAARGVGDLWYQARFLGMLGDIRMTLNDPGAAVACYEPEVVLDRRVGDLERLPIALAHLGLAYRALGRIDDAAEVLEKARALFAERGEEEGAAWVARLLEGLATSSQENGAGPATPPP